MERSTKYYLQVKGIAEEELPDLNGWRLIRDITGLSEAAFRHGKASGSYRYQDLPKAIANTASWTQASDNHILECINSAYEVRCHAIHMPNSAAWENEKEELITLLESEDISPLIMAIWGVDETNHFIEDNWEEKLVEELEEDRINKKTGKRILCEKNLKKMLADVTTEKELKEWRELAGKANNLEELEKMKEEAVIKEQKRRKREEPYFVQAQKEKDGTMFQEMILNGWKTITVNQKQLFTKHTDEEVRLIKQSAQFGTKIALNKIAIRPKKDWHIEQYKIAAEETAKRKKALEEALENHKKRR